MSEDRNFPSQGVSRVFASPAFQAKLNIFGHIPGLDSLRGYAICMVILYHAYAGDVDYRRWNGPIKMFIFLTAYGAFGVQLFFVLSGFLITSILIRNISHPSYYRNFYTGRALRILPAYIAMLAILKIWMGVTWKYILACLLYIANMAGIVGAKTSEYGSLWSLAVEEQFYLLWPLCVKKMKLQTLLKLAIGICILCPILRTTTAILFPSVDVYYKIYFAADALLCGAIISICAHLGILNTKNIRFISRGLLFVGLSTIFAILSLRYSGHVWTKFGSILVRTNQILPFIWIYCALVLMAIQRHHLGDQQANRFFSLIGYISYGLYLIHPFLFFLYDKLAYGTMLAAGNWNFATLSLRFVIVTLVAVFLSYLSRRFYEERFLRYKVKI